MRVVVLIIGVISSVIVVAALGFAFWDHCDSSAIEEFRSPSGKRKVVVFVRDCGATTSFSTQASLVDADSPAPKGAGNILILDDDNGKAPADDHGKIPVNVRFIDESTLALAYPARTRVFQQVAKKDGVAIHYERVPSGK